MMDESQYKSGIARIIFSTSFLDKIQGPIKNNQNIQDTFDYVTYEGTDNYKFVLMTKFKNGETVFMFATATEIQEESYPQIYVDWLDRYSVKIKISLLKN